jgi:hypothetical protein
VELKESNHEQLQAMMKLVISRAADEFDRATNTNATVRNVVASVLRVTYDTSKAKIEKIEAEISALLGDMSEEAATLRTQVEQSHPDAALRLRAVQALQHVLSQAAENVSTLLFNVPLPLVSLVLYYLLPSCLQFFSDLITFRLFCPPNLSVP